MVESFVHSPSSKKRKLRKGTHSCWECKRRKAKCVFAQSEDSVCVGCRNRGTVCKGQDEEVQWADKEGGETKVSNQRLERVEYMLETLLKDRGLQTKPTSGNHEQQASSDSERPSSPTWALEEAQTLPKPVENTIHSGLNSTLSETLYALLPSTQECQLICKHKNAEFTPCFFQQLLSRKYLGICNTSPELASRKGQLAIFPPPNAHPIVLAQRLLILATISQYHSESATQCKTRAQHMADTVIELITTKDHLFRNAEGLECLMLEATFHSNSGNIRRAFTTIRRAMALAQLLGIHRPGQQSPQQIDNRAPKFDPPYMWFKIVYLDRLYCLILGLPQGSSDVKFLDALTVLEINFEEHLEREHCIIASKILERNEIGTTGACALTRAIDEDLQSAAALAPPEWWLLPTLSPSLSQRDRFRATGRLATHLFHFNLINQAHLPYIFPSIPHDDQTSSPSHSYTATPIHEASKAACATASREMLSRYLLAQESSLVAHAYTFLDFFTLIAAMTLLVLHIDNHWLHRPSSTDVPPPAPHILSHIRPSDRAMLERLAHHMSLKDTSTSSKGLQVIRELLAVEDEAFRFGSVGAGQIVKTEGDVPVNARERFFEIRMPWYGLLRLSARHACFRRSPEVEEVQTSFGEADAVVSEGGEGGVGGGANVEGETLLSDWVTGGFGLQSGFGGHGEEDLSGIEMAFFDSLVANAGM